MTTSGGASLPFATPEDGRIQIGSELDEMDMAAEKVAREILSGE